MELRELQRGIVMDPRRLEEVEERLQLLHKLKRKYGASIEDILQLKDRLAEMMDNLDQSKEELGRHGEPNRRSGEGARLSKGDPFVPEKKTGSRDVLRIP